MRALVFLVSCCWVSSAAAWAAVSDAWLHEVCPNADGYALRAGRSWAPHSSAPGGDFATLAGGIPSELFRGRRLLEIGGPSSRAVDAIYEWVRTDSTNVIYRPTWSFGGQPKPIPGSKDTCEGRLFTAPSGRVIGTVLQRHGAVLMGVPDASYGIVMASHSLENFADPIAALREWNRVLEPGGTLVLVLPWAPKTRDRDRAPATPQQLLHRHQDNIYEGLRAATNGLDNSGLERYQAKMEKVVKELTSGHRAVELDPALNWNETLQPVEKAGGGGALTEEGKVHWNVFDFELLRELVSGCLGYRVVHMSLKDPYHQTVIAIKPNKQPARAEWYRPNPVRPAGVPPRVLALIPIRSGSKSLPHKNIRPLAGKPLVAHTIEHALASTRVSRVLVSTDSEQYRQIVLEHGAEAPFLRPAVHAGDLVGDLPVVKHALRWLAENEGYSPDIIVHLRATCPMRNATEIDRAVDMLLAQPDGVDAVRSVTPVEGPDPWRMWVHDSESSGGEMMMRQLAVPPGMRTGQAGNSPRQSLPPVYVQDSCIDVAWTKTIAEKGSMTGSSVLGLMLPKSIDIDNEAHFAAAVSRMAHPGGGSIPAAVAAPDGGVGGGNVSRTGITTDQIHRLLSARDPLRGFLGPGSEDSIGDAETLGAKFPEGHALRMVLLGIGHCFKTSSAPYWEGRWGLDHGVIVSVPEYCGPRGLFSLTSSIAGHVGVHGEAGHAGFPPAASLGTCAVVGSSGRLAGASLGGIIDGHDSIIRFNHAPVRGYESDVGSRTSFRFWQEGTVHRKVWLEEDSILVAVGNSPLLFGVVATLLELSVHTGGDLPGPIAAARIQTLPLSFLAHVSESWLNIIGTQKHRQYKGMLGSAGLTGVLWALRRCTSVSAFGFGRVVGKPLWYFDAAEGNLFSGHASWKKSVEEGSNENPKEQSYHDWEYEADLLRDLVDAGALTIYN